MDDLLYAESKNYALLKVKEVVLDFIVENEDEVIFRISIPVIPGTVISDVLSVMAREEKRCGSDDIGEIRFNTMCTSMT